MGDVQGVVSAVVVGMAVVVCRKKGQVNLMQRVKIAHSLLQSVSHLFHFIILSLFMYLYI